MTPLPRLVVAVDGPAGAGKGAVCRAVATRFGFAYLETGAIYRAVGLITLEENLVTPETVAARARAMDFGFRPVGDGAFRAFLGPREVTLDLRREEVGQAASRVAAMPLVRAALLDYQRHYGQPGPVILDGRDVGSVVFPEADLKIFLTASLDERAKRRALELRERGEPVNFDGIRSSMAERDTRDAERDHAPLLPTADAILLDTTPLSLSESVGRVMDLVTELLRRREINF